MKSDPANPRDIVLDLCGARLSQGAMDSLIKMIRSEDCKYVNITLRHVDIDNLPRILIDYNSVGIKREDG